MKISIISPCRNEVAYIDSFLQSVLEQDCHAFDLEIVIADGLSDDGTIEKLNQWVKKDSRIKVIQNPGRIVSTGLNRAISAASGQIIIRMDIHTLYASDYVRQCVSTLNRTGAQCVGGPWYAEGVTCKQQAIANAFQSRFGSGGAATRRPEYSGPVDTVYLGAWRKTDLEELGGFDEELVRNQDDELCMRITRAGGKIWQSTEIRSVYTPRNSLTDLLQQFYQYGYWKALVLKKHRIPASLRHLAPFSFIAGLTVLVVLTPFSQLAGLLLAFVFGTYLSAAIFFAWLANREDVSVNGVFFTAMAFMLMHFGYGIGFGHGFLDFFLFSQGANKSMTSLTR